MAGALINRGLGRNVTRPEREFNFHLEEYKSLRKEILMQQKNRFQAFQFGGAASIAVWAFLISDSFQKTNSFLLGLAWFIPVIIGTCGFIYSLGRNNTFEITVLYLRQIENVYSNPRLQGFEEFIHDPNSENVAIREKAKMKKFPVKNTQIIVYYWGSLTFISYAIAIVYNISEIYYIIHVIFFR